MGPWVHGSIGPWVHGSIGLQDGRAGLGLRLSSRQPMDSWTYRPTDLLLPHPERVGDPVRVAEPAGDDANLEDRLVVEARFAELVEVLRAELGRIARELLDELEH